MRVFLACLSICFYHTVCAQTDSIQYTSEFQFTNGVYQSMQEFKANKPSIPLTNIIIDSDLDPSIRHVLHGKEIYYYDWNKVRRSIKGENIWGYCIDESVFVRRKDGIYRVFKMGSLMLFTISRIGSTYSSLDGSDSYLIKSSKEVPFIMDFETGQAERFNVQNLHSYLKKDPILDKEYSSLNSYKKREKLKFIYLNKFNDRNPIYFPE